MITVAGSVLVAVVTGVFALAANRDDGSAPPTTTVAVAGSSTATSGTDPSFTVDTTVPEGEQPASAQVESVEVEADDIGKVGAGLYQLAGHSGLDFRYWWTTVMTITNLGAGKVVDKQRSANCTMQGWHSAQLPQGRYRLAVAVALESGSKGSGSYSFTVVP